MAPFDHQSLFAGEYVCVMRKGNPLANGPLTVKRYCAAHHLLVSFSGRPFGYVDEALASLGRTRRIVLTVNQFFTAGRVVASSDLLTVLPRHFVRMTGMAHEFVMRDLPFEVAPVLVDSLWHRRQGQRSDHAWLRLAVAATAQKAFADER
jgi:DNA-binding transcriptional LysR family regulator